MTPATFITVFRLLLIPAFAYAAIRYGQSAQAPVPEESWRHLAVFLFTLASVSDALDGWIARRFQQFSKLGAFLDPLADKALLLTALLILSLINWGPNWRIPWWLFCAVVARDLLIVGGLWILKAKRKHVKIHPHWSGKVCTVTQMIAIGWVMLKAVPFSPVIPAIPAFIMTCWSGVIYYHQGYAILKNRVTYED